MAVLHFNVHKTAAKIAYSICL